MPARIQVTFDDEQSRKAFEAEKKAWEASKDAAKKHGKEVNRVQKAQIRQAATLIRRQRDEEKVLSDNIAALRVYGKTSAEAGEKSRAAIKLLIAKHRENKEAIDATKRAEAAAAEQLKESITRGVTASGRLKEATGRIRKEYVGMKDDIDAAFEAGEIGAEEHREALQKIENAQQDTFGEQAIGKLGKYFGALGAGAAVFATMQKRLERINELQQEALAAAKETVPADIRLASVFVEDTPQAIKRADTTAFNLGLDREASKELLFQAKSSGFVDDFEKVARGSLALGSAEAAGIAAGKVRKSFPELSTDEALNLSLNASQISDLAPDAFTRSLPNATSAGRKIKATPVETFAIQGQLAFLKKSGDEAATSLKAFASTANKAGFGGDGFLTAVDRFDALGKEKFDKAIGGNQEALDTFNDLKLLRKQIEESKAELARAKELAGTAESPLNRVIGVVEKLPSFIASKTSQQTKLESEFRNESRAVEASRIEKTRRQVKDNTQFNALDVPLSALDSIPVVGDAFKPTVSENAVEVGNAIGGADGANIFRNLFSVLGFEQEFKDDRTKRPTDADRTIPKQAVEGDRTGSELLKTNQSQVKEAAQQTGVITRQTDRQIKLAEEHTGILQKISANSNLVAGARADQSNVLPTKNGLQTLEAVENPGQGDRAAAGQELLKTNQSQLTMAERQALVSERQARSAEEQTRLLRRMARDISRQKPVEQPIGVE